jgi:hypothetical protein
MQVIDEKDFVISNCFLISCNMFFFETINNLIKQKRNNNNKNNGVID